MGGHQTYPGQDLDRPIPRNRPPSKEYEQGFWTAGVTYMSLGALNPPGGALTPTLRNWALKKGFGQRAALLIGLGGEWASGLFMIGLAGWIFDPLDLYEGGLIPDEVAQITTVPAWEFIVSTKKELMNLGGAAPVNFEMDQMGSFQ